MVNNLGKILFSKLQELREESGGSIDINNVDAIVESFMSIIKSHVNSANDLALFTEIEKIAEQIKITKIEVAKVDQTNLHEDFPDATSQLELVTQATEASTDAILEATEEIQALTIQIDNEETRKKIQSKTLRIIELCSFQDLTGQKINKVINTLNKIESIVLKLVKTFKPDKKIMNNHAQKKTREEKLLNGPQLGKDAPSQKEIDDFFDNL